MHHGWMISWLKTQTHARRATVRLISVSSFLILIQSSILPRIWWREQIELKNSLWWEWYFLGLHRHIIHCAAVHCGLFKVSHLEGRRRRRSRDSVVWGHRWWSPDQRHWPSTLLCRNIPRLRWRRPIGSCLSFNFNHDKGNSSKGRFQCVKSSTPLQKFSQVCPPSASSPKHWMAFLQFRRDSSHWRNQDNEFIWLFHCP